jgi:hypothetical protein
MSKTLTTPNYKEMSFNINRIGGFEFPLAVSIWKAQHQTFDKFEHMMRGNYDGTEFNDFFDVVRKAWDDAPALTVKQAFTAPNIEHRRVIFNVMGVDKLMAVLKPELIDSKTITRENLVYDSEGNSQVELLIDTYELYKIDGDRLFEGTGNANRWDRDRSVYAVKCKDASTDREYWIYVHAEAAKNNDALEAIAWTYQMKSSVYTNSIYRQGEVIIAKHDGVKEIGKNQWGTTYQLTKEDYLTKIKAQS